ncbi:GGDEF domain-containing protein [Neptuniibacter halophilus]|uniref:GGDEF domain-containing protein n=1 Tax=Neptuniibacter halophilus TaxID=651666 RepID=UPI00257394A7|nr:GGDEF domain-containing protein [Neptuniibacter halophilus]
MSKRYRQRIAVMAVFILCAILLMGGVLFYLSSEVRTAWVNYSQTSASRTTALAELHRAIGYGGFIHNFKNYVLRQDQGQLQRLNADLKRSYSALDRYQKLHLTEKEVDALEIIRSQLKSYQRSIEVVQMGVIRDETPQAIDSRVRLNDAPALSALHRLQQENRRFSQRVSEEMRKQIDRLMGTLLFGLLAMPFVVLMAYQYQRVMGKLVALAVEKKQVQRELEDTAALAAEAVQTQLQLDYEAHHCELTRVPNRKAFMKQSRELLDQARQRNDCLAVLFVDVDDFKDINDRYGHEVGDKVLVEVASRLLSALREEDFVARLGGDEFAMIVQCPESAVHSERLAERLHEVLNESFDSIMPQMSVSCSVGGAFFPDEGDSMDELIRMADQRMYCVKKSGKNGVYLQG